VSKNEFLLGRLTHNGRSFVGVVQDSRVWEISRLLGFDTDMTMLELLERWPTVDAMLAEVMPRAPEGESLRLDALKVEAPVTPRQIFCIGANYRTHVIQLSMKQPDPSTAHMSAEERAEAVRNMMDERVRAGTPYAFLKLPSCVTGPYDQIILPRQAREPDWELELAVVIGKPARNIARADAFSVVAGYTIVNDVTTRDRIYRPDLKAIGTDWLAAKNSPTFLPLGPWLRPARFVPDPQNLRITLKLNGKTMQDESTSDMIFDVARQIEYISSYVKLLPGDLICTGSPAGNGTHYQRFLAPGDVVEGTITGLGSQRLVCVSEGLDGAPC